MSGKKHFVLVHGAGHGAWEWYIVKTMLEDAGHTVTVMDMAASGINLKRLYYDVKTFEEYSKPLLDFMAILPSDEKVILVGQSFGGMNIALAMNTQPEKVSVGVFINAYMPDTTHAPSYVIQENDKIPSDPMDNKAIDRPGMTEIKFGPEFLKAKLYQLSPDRDYTLALSLSRITSFFVDELEKQPPYSEDKYGSVPRVTMIAENDLCIIPPFQEWMNKNYPANEVIKLPNTDHVAFFSNPDGVVYYLLEIAKKY